MVRKSVGVPMRRRHLRAESRVQQGETDSKREEHLMYPLTDPQIHLDLHRQRADDLRREAEAYHTAHAASVGRHRSHGLQSWLPRRARPVRPAAAS
jgi:hypothetical protein